MNATGTLADVEPWPLTVDDLDWVTGLAAARRAQLAPFAPRFWNPSPDARAVHAEFLGRLKRGADSRLLHNVTSRSGSPVIEPVCRIRAVLPMADWLPPRGTEPPIMALPVTRCVSAKIDARSHPQRDSGCPARKKTAHPCYPAEAWTLDNGVAGQAASVTLFSAPPRPTRCREQRPPDRSGGATRRSSRYQGPPVPGRRRTLKSPRGRAR